MKIGLIDYGMGNMHSIAKALEHVGGTVQLVKTAEELGNTSRIVLPGVGAFRDCSAALKASGLGEAIKEKCTEGVPFLGICLGMQVMLTSSREFGLYPGLNLIRGTVKSFPESHPERGYKIPHMGWNDILFSSEKDIHPVLKPLENQQVYYVHSYCCAPENPEHILGVCSYGEFPFASAIGKANMIGVQFHPEKSQRAGMALLEAFLKWNL